MDQQKLIQRLEMLIASTAIIQKEATDILKELQPEPAKAKKGGLTAEQQAKLVAEYEAKLNRKLNRAKRA